MRGGERVGISVDIVKTVVQLLVLLQLVHAWLGKEISLGMVDLHLVRSGSWLQLDFRLVRSSPTSLQRIDGDSEQDCAAQRDGGGQDSRPRR